MQGTASVWEGREREIKPGSSWIHSRPLKHCEEGEKASSSSGILKELREPYQALGTRWGTHLEENMADDPKPELLFENLSEAAKVYSLTPILAHSVS